MASGRTFLGMWSWSGSGLGILEMLTVDLLFSKLIDFCSKKKLRKVNIAPPNFKKKKRELESLPCFAADLCRSIHKSWNQPKSATCAELALPTQEMAIYSPLTPDTPDPEAPPQAVDKPEASQHWPLRHSATRALFSKTLHRYMVENLRIKIWLRNQCQNTWDQRWMKVAQILGE